MGQFIRLHYRLRNAGHVMCFAFAPLAFVASGVLSGSFAPTDTPAHLPHKLPLAISDVAFAEHKRPADASGFARVVHGRIVGQSNVDVSLDDEKRHSHQAPKNIAKKTPRWSSSSKNDKVDDARHVWEHVVHAITPDRVDHGVDIVGGMMLSQVDQVEGNVEGVVDIEPMKAKRKKLAGRVEDAENMVKKAKTPTRQAAARTKLKKPTEKNMAAQLKAKVASNKPTARVTSKLELLKRKKERAGKGAAKKLLKVAVEKKMAADFKSESVLSKIKAKQKIKENMVKRELDQTTNNLLEKRRRESATALLRRRLAAQQKKLEADVQIAKSMVKNAKTQKAQLAAKKMLRKATENKMRADLNAEVADAAMKQVKSATTSKANAGEQKIKTAGTPSAVDQTAKSMSKKDQTSSAGVAATKCTKKAAEVAKANLVIAAKTLCKCEKEAAKNAPKKKVSKAMSTPAVKESIKKVIEAKKVLGKVHTPVAKALATVGLKKAEAQEKMAEKKASASTPPPKVAKQIAKAEITDAKQMVKVAKTPEGKKLAEKMLAKAENEESAIKSKSKLKKLHKALKEATTPAEKMKLKNACAKEVRKLHSTTTTTTRTLFTLTTTAMSICTTTTTLGPVEIARKKIMKKDANAVKEAKKMIAEATTPVGKATAKKVLGAAEAKLVEAALMPPCELKKATPKPEERTKFKAMATPDKMPPLPPTIGKLVKKAIVTTVTTTCACACTTACCCNSPCGAKSTVGLGDAQKEGAAAIKAIERANTPKKKKAALSDLQKATADKKKALRKVQQT